MATVIRRRRRGLWMTSLLAAGSLLYTLFVFLPGQRTLSELREKLRRQQEFVVASERLKSTISLTKAQLTQVQDYCARWDCNRPLARRLPEFLARITGAADRNRVTLVRLMPARSEDFSTFERITLEVSVTGPLDGVLGLLKEVDRLPELHWVEHLEIRRVFEGEGQVDSTFRLVLFAGFSEESG
ncbi:MAG TPA: hypothetical protein ENJ16_00095 [Planctomycetaceae bacterium]|nr:hypothetical protein [Planctomycetaceae bacterium]